MTLRSPGHTRPYAVLPHHLSHHSLWALLHKVLHLQDTIPTEDVSCALAVVCEKGPDKCCPKFNYVPMALMVVRTCG